MDLSWATQESEAVAEKVLRYRRDASGWKKCREGVSGGLGGKRDLETAPRAWSPPNSQASPLLEIIRTQDSRGGLRERFHCGCMFSGTPGDPCPFISKPTQGHQTATELGLDLKLQVPSLSYVLYCTIPPPGSAREIVSFLEPLTFFFFFFKESPKLLKKTKVLGGI